MWSLHDALISLDKQVGVVTGRGSGVKTVLPGQPLMVAAARKKKEIQLLRRNISHKEYSPKLDYFPITLQVCFYTSGIFTALLTPSIK